MPISNDVQSKKIALRASQRSDVKQLLRTLIESLGHDPDLIHVKDLEELAARLSEVAQRTKDGKQPWGWRYLRNVLNENIDASADLMAAIYALGAHSDGTPKLVAMARQVMVLAVGNVKPGALILADSKRCRNPWCPIWFVPRSGNQKYHSTECRKDHLKKQRESSKIVLSKEQPS